MIRRYAAAARVRTARALVAARMESLVVQRAIITLVIVNAITLGLETVPAVAVRAGSTLQLIDRSVLMLFVAELALKLFAHGWRFFRTGWNVFDFVIVGIALAPASGPLTVFRALRVLRILRLTSAIPRMRFVVESLVRMLPGIGSILLLLGFFFYVFSVAATKLFADDFPQWFGSLWASGFSLFQIMTLEGWADISRAVMAVYPAAWLFFVSFILLSTFIMLNLFIGLVVKAMEEEPAAQEPSPVSGSSPQAVAGTALAVSPPSAEDIKALRKEMAELRAAIERMRS